VLVLKSKIINLKDKFIEEIIKCIFMLALYFLYNKNLYTQKDFFSRIRDSSVILIPYLIYIILISINSFFARPLIVVIKVKNFLIEGREETTLYHCDGSFREDINKITLTLEMKNNYSLHTSFAKHILKNKRITINIGIVPFKEAFICESCVHSEKIDFQGSYTILDISNIIISNLEERTSTIVKYDFIVKENRDNPPETNCCCAIKPTIFINGKKLGFFYKRFIKYKLELKKGEYSINFIK
jgi:hypothetical protein